MTPEKPIVAAQDAWMRHLNACIRCRTERGERYSFAIKAQKCFEGCKLRIKRIDAWLTNKTGIDELWVFCDG